MDMCWPTHGDGRFFQWIAYGLFVVRQPSIETGKHG